jgi:hypothetical protein
MKYYLGDQIEESKMSGGEGRVQTCAELCLRKADENTLKIYA